MWRKKDEAQSVWKLYTEHQQYIKLHTENRMRITGYNRNPSETENLKKKKKGLQISMICLVHNLCTLCKQTWFTITKQSLKLFLSLSLALSHTPMLPIYTDNTTYEIWIKKKGEKVKNKPYEKWNIFNNEAEDQQDKKIWCSVEWSEFWSAPIITSLCSFIFVVAWA